MEKKELRDLENEDIQRIIEMAWEDRTPFEAIEIQFGVTEAGTIEIMRQSLKSGSFRAWRKRTRGRKTKFSKLFGNQTGFRHRCYTQGKDRSRRKKSI